MKEALYYKLEDDKIRCQLCPQNCLIAEGRSGKCRVRKVKNGKLYATSYGEVSALNIDPIEKKPLYHFYPGSRILSLGTVGCNLSCNFCQNYSIAQEEARETKYLSPKEAVALAKEKNSLGIAYTYSEPLVWYEYILATAKLARKNNLENVLVTNGMINSEPFNELIKIIDAMNIDLKAFSNQFYQKLCGGMLEPVKQRIKSASERVHLEITTLLIPGHNDSEEMIERLTDWIAEIDPEISLHLSRYFPNYQLQEEITPVETLLKAKKIAEQKLDYVYLGNLKHQQARDTYCPECNNLLIKRDLVLEINLSNNQCPNCGKTISVIS